MPKVYIPTLTTSAGFVSDINDKAATLLRFFVYNPGEASDNLSTAQVSLRDLAYQYQNNPANMAAVVERQLNSLYQKNFPEISTNVTVRHKDLGGGKYKLIINVQGSSNGNDYKPLILTSTVEIGDNFSINLKYR